MPRKIVRCCMTEQEWLQATDPEPMLEFIQVKASQRKLRLFAVGCSRHFEHLRIDEWTHLGPVWLTRHENRSGRHRSSSGLVPSDSPVQVDRLRDIFGNPFRPITLDPAWLTWHDGQLVSMARQMYYDFAAEVPKIARWRRWVESLLRRITPWSSIATKSMYDIRDFSDMPILADALEEAGCTNQDILGHCRSGGEHVLGCWVVDLILGKE
jgi:hypothetical protein